MFLIRKLRRKSAPVNMETIVREDFHRSVLCVRYFILQCLRASFFIGSTDVTKYIPLTIPALVQDVITMQCFVWRCLWEFPRSTPVFFWWIWMVSFSKSMSQNLNARDVAASEAGVQRQQENRLDPLADKAVRPIFQKVCLYFSSIVVMIFCFWTGGF